MKARVLSTVLLVAFFIWAYGHGENRNEEVADFIHSQEAIVKDIAGNMSRLHAKRQHLVKTCECSPHICGEMGPKSTCFTYLDTPKICQGHKQGWLVDNTTSIVRTPPGVTAENLTRSQKEGICISRHLDSTFKRIGVHEIGWMYIGLQDGHVRRYPATAGERDEEREDDPFHGCKTFDPRIRPWYIAASTGPKDIVLVVDKSGSMANPIGLERDDKWDVAKRAVSDILATLSVTDFVNVVTFSDGAEPLRNETGLLRGTKDNLQFLRDRLDGVNITGNTNFTAAFSTAFRLLAENCTDEQKVCSNCEKIILFLTDGTDTSEENEQSIKPSKMAKRISSLQRNLKKETNRTAAIFTYSMTTDADDAIPRQIACANNGAWSFIGPDTNVLDALNTYTQYLANDGSSASPVWTMPFEDFGGLGQTITVAMPIYAKVTGAFRDVFIGVAGHDVPLRELEIGGLTADQIRHHIVDHSGKCRPSNSDQCDLQFFRENNHDSKSLCPDIYRTHAKGDKSSTFCYMQGRFYYKRISEEIDWTEARSRCMEDGGQLVSVHDEEELAFIANMASLDGSWIGLRGGSSGTFVWNDSRRVDVPVPLEYWGVGEPGEKNSSAFCGAIDSRGVIGNLRAAPCHDSLSFICRYEDETSCGSKLKKIPKEGYFEIPPLDRCSEPVEIDPLILVDNLDSTDVICDIGNFITNEEATCCESNDNFIKKSALAVLIVLGSIGFICSILCFGLFAFRRRRRFQ